MLVFKDELLLRRGQCLMLYMLLKRQTHLRYDFYNFLGKIVAIYYKIICLSYIHYINYKKKRFNEIKSLLDHVTIQYAIVKPIRRSRQPT